MGSQFLKLIMVCGFALALAACAHKRVCRAIVRRRAARLPKGPDAERAREELESMLDEMTTAERLELSASLLLNSAVLHVKPGGPGPLARAFSLLS